MADKITMSDMAAELGVSVATVHRALTNRGRINKETREKILELAKKMNYRPNLVARTLSSKKNIRIAFSSPDNFFYSEIIEGIKAAMEEYRHIGISTDFILTEDYSPHKQTEQLIRVLEDGGYDAVAISPTHTLLLNPIVEKFIAGGKPVITVNNDLGNTSRSCYVGENSYMSGHMAAQIYCDLMDEGSHIALMRSLVSAEGLHDRITGFMDYVSEQKKINILGIYDFYDNIGNAHEISKQILLTTRAKGIFCNSMMGTIGMARAAGELSPEKRPFMIGYDFNEEIETCIRENILYGILFQSPFSQGYYAVKLIRQLIDGSIPQAIQESPFFYIPTQLILKTNLIQIWNDKRIKISSQIELPV
ncbi:MAG: substrate-binding domain-containing protein [Treponema sp.]|nr:substrate-binding domain-containing protein [Treponema sp.]